MNYLEYFGLQQEPFTTTPATKFYYNSAQHSSAMMRITHAVEGMRGLILTVGDVGTGKTTLARKFLEGLSPETYQAAMIVVVHSSISAAWFLRKISRQLGVENPKEDKVELLGQVHERLAEIQKAGKKCVVLIDEAQMFESKEVLEEIRGLLNLESGDTKLVTFVLFGLHELRETLDMDPPLRQRVAMQVQLESLTKEGAEQYIAHRLRLVGAQRPLFNDEALDAIYIVARGIPRVINILCDNCLLETFLMGREIVTKDIVEAIAVDLGMTSQATQDATTADILTSDTEDVGSEEAQEASSANTEEIATADDLELGDTDALLDELDTLIVDDQEIPSPDAVVDDSQTAEDEDIATLVDELDVLIEEDVDQEIVAPDNEVTEIPTVADDEVETLLDNIEIEEGKAVPSDDELDTLIAELENTIDQTHVGGEGEGTDALLQDEADELLREFDDV